MCVCVRVCAKSVIHTINSTPLYIYSLEQAGRGKSQLGQSTADSMEADQNTGVLREGFLVKRVSFFQWMFKT